VEFDHSRIYTGMVLGMAFPKMGRNGILFVYLLLIVYLFVTSPLSLQRDSFITSDLKDFSVPLTLNFAFLPWKLIVSHSQGFSS
jgi:hypothetical protein